MRCYFHLVNSHETILDEEGIEVSNLGAAEAEALKAIAELRRELADPARDWSGWRLDVVDASGRTLLSIPLEPTLQ